MPRVVRMKTGEIMDGLAADIGNENHDGFMRGISKTGSKDDNELYNIDPKSIGYHLVPMLFSIEALHM